MKTLAASILLATSASFAATIVTTRAAANVYPNEIRRVYERPVFKLEKGEVVEVIKWGTPLTKIMNRRGRFGWVEPAALDSLKRPPILNLIVDSSEASSNAIDGRRPVQASPKSLSSADSSKKSLEKPVDFQQDSTHISARSKADSLK